MFERLLIVALLFALGFAAYWLLTRWQMRRIRPTDPVLSSLQPGIPAVVYFTTPGCIPCKTQQQPALKEIRQTMDVQVVQIDATEDPASADRWGVMTAPTTFIIDRHGQTTAVNHGVADSDKLRRQLESE